MSTSIPMLVIDPKKHRIRFHKTLLEELDLPKYIYLMVNQKTKIIAVHSIQNECTGCITINSQIVTDNSCEIYSLSLTSQLCSTLGWTDHSVSYRLKGKIHPKYKVAVFPTKNAEKIMSEVS